MRRIPDEDINRIKRDSDLIAIIQARGVKLNKQGQNWTGLCPFHKDEKTPNLIVTPHKGLFRCMASCCGKAGNAIQFIQWHDNVSFRYAFELLDAGGTAAFQTTRQGVKSYDKKLENPLTAEQEHQMLDQVARFYHSRLASVNGHAAVEYLADRGIVNEELVKKFQIGISDRSIGLRIPHSRTVEGAKTRKKLAEIGVYRQTGTEHLNGCVTVPLRDFEGNVVQMYGRRMDRRAPKDKRHLYLGKPLAGIFNPEAFEPSNSKREIILCESIIDALTFWHHGMKNVTCIYGTGNFTDEIFEAIKDRKTETVRMAYDADKSGEEAFLKHAMKLEGIGCSVYRIKFPWGMDANEFAQNQGGEALKKAVRDALWFSNMEYEQAKQIDAIKKQVEASEATSSEADGASPAPSNNKIAANLAASEVDAEVAKEEKLLDAQIAQSVAALPELVKVGDYYEFAVGERVYRVGGLHKNNSLEVLRVTLRITFESLMHVDSLDLYRDGERRKFVDRASEETMLDKLLLKRDLGKLLLALEQAQEARLNGEEPSESEDALSPSEQAQALDFLKLPNLLERIAKSYDSAGLVGEATNKLAAYLACVSRKLSKPLAVIIQSTSAAGKSTLMEAVLSFFPKDELVKYSAMTGQSLYYLGEANLKHKILAIVEEEGAEKASYALKLLQSEGELTIASTGKDPHSGRMETQEYHVEGPVAIVFTTTSIDIDEELMNRCLVLTVDESKEQTEKIHELQRLARTPEGIIASEKRKDIQKLMQNAQRLIVPMKIANPYARHLTFTSGRTRTRRDHEKYLTLIDTIALLHQHQRETVIHKIGTGENAREIEMLPVTLDDIEAANKIAPEVLGRSLDELPPQTRSLLDSIKALIREKLEANPSWEQNTTFFSRKELRDLSGWSQTQIRRHLDCLIDLEYVRQQGGKNGVTMRYELLANLDETKNYAIGLIDLTKLKTQQRKEAS